MENENTNTVEMDSFIQMPREICIASVLGVRGTDPACPALGNSHGYRERRL
jgi:hypothetical protein